MAAAGARPLRLPGTQRLRTRYVTCRRRTRPWWHSPQCKKTRNMHTAGCDAHLPVLGKDSPLHSAEGYWKLNTRKNALASARNKSLPGVSEREVSMRRYQVFRRDVVSFG